MAIKPVCRKCSTPHWPFVPCAEAEIADEQETRNAAERDRLKVVPIWRTGNDRVPHDSLRTLVQVAPNVFIQKRPDDAA